MNTAKRHIGRAIRKRRRQQRALIAAVSRVDWGAFAARMSEGPAQMGATLVKIGDAMTAFATAYQEAVAQQHRMTFRALTTGHEENN